jgi:hypothetical protein
MAAVALLCLTWPARAAGFVDAMGEAQTEVFAAIPHPSAEEIAAFIAAERRGVEVNLIIAPDAPPLPQLEEVGVNVSPRECAPPFVVVDNEIIYLNGRRYRNPDDASELQERFTLAVLAGMLPGEDSRCED